MIHEDVTERIIGAFYEVYRSLGCGFLEKVYENALMVEFERIGLEFRNQCPIKIGYKGKIVGDYVADFLVEDKVIVEIKALRELSSNDEAQLLNYLLGTGIRVGLLLNFGPKPKLKRMIN